MGQKKNSQARDIVELRWTGQPRAAIPTYAREGQG